mmetsp:Transcript_122662/g.392105  ORF Transcript_122662/g.392105 Transcript_122662/m.392105 type:complete len:376 (+) Transcript_122662:36-1163(+)
MASGSDGAAAAGPTSLSAPFRVWVQVKDGGPVEYDVDCTWSVSRLLKQVHDGEKLTVGFGKLTLYTSDTKEQALKPGQLVSTIDGGKDDDHPFYVDFPDSGEPAVNRLKIDMDAQAALLDEVKKCMQDGIAMVKSEVKSEVAAVKSMVQDEVGPLLHDAKLRRMKLLDPWRSMSHTTPRDEKFKPRLVDFYNCGAQEGWVWCQVLREPLPSDQVSAAHIWPWSTRGEGLHEFGLQEKDVNHERNGLLLAKSIEEAFDRKQLCFVYNFLNGKFIVSVLDDSIKETKVCESSSKKFKDLHEKELWTNEGESIPFRRLLSWHAARTFDRFNLLPDFKPYHNASMGQLGFKVPLEVGMLKTMVEEGMAASDKLDATSTA